MFALSDHATDEPRALRLARYRRRCVGDGAIARRRFPERSQRSGSFTTRQGLSRGASCSHPRSVSLKTASPSTNTISSSRRRRLKRLNPFDETMAIFFHEGHHPARPELSRLASRDALSTRARQDASRDRRTKAPTSSIRAGSRKRWRTISRSVGASSLLEDFQSYEARELESARRPLPRL